MARRTHPELPDDNGIPTLVSGTGRAGRRLSFSAQKYVLQRLAEGASNNEIREGIRSLGYKYTLSDHTLAKYRKSPWLQQNLDRQIGDSVKTGYAMRHRRVLLVDAMIKDLSQDFFGTIRGVDPENVRMTEADIETKTLLVKSIIPLLKEMGRLMGEDGREPIEAIRSAKDDPSQNTVAGAAWTQLSGMLEFVTMMEDFAKQAMTTVEPF